MENEEKVREQKSVIKRILMYIFIIIFFVGIVVIYYRQLYSETTDNIVNSGRINAIESATQINSRLDSAVNVLELVCYNIDKMTAYGRPTKDILGYLESESSAISESLIPNCIGIYGYINGEYLDGAGWVPDDSYVATERPWYTEAIAAGGETVIVNPYIDDNTGEVTTSIVKTLSDGESVVAIDIYMNDMQAIVEQYGEISGSYAEFVVSSKGIIIAHSDKNLIGTDVTTGSDALSKTIAENLNKPESSYYYFEYAGSSFLVYLMPLENGWTCVSAIDATSDYANLRGPLFVTILIAIFMVALFIFFVSKSELKSIESHESALKAEKALASNEAKTAFLSNMSHEIRTPINAILGLNEMVLRETDDESILAYSENIKSAGSTLLGLINDILDFSKIDAGKIEIIPVEYDIASVINDLVNMVHTRADDKGLALNLDFDPDMPSRLYGDEVRVKQIITNILTNAVKYTERGSVTFKIGYEKVDHDNVMLKVSVTDTGIGIREDDIDKLFSKFDRIDEKRNRNIEGTGLGMSITKSLLELMDSELRVSSVYGKGSTFSFDLKQKIVNHLPLGDYEAAYKTHLKNHAKYHAKFTAPDARVLVVDDNEMNLIVFKGLIKGTGIQTDIAISGDEGIALTKENKYDVIFLDHMMPGKDGIETLTGIRSDAANPNASTPSVCLTANAVSGAREEYVEAGFDDYLPKPIDCAKLEEMLYNYLPKNKLNIVKESEAAHEETSVEIPENLIAIDSDVINLRRGMENNCTVESYLNVAHVYYDSVDKAIAEIEGYLDSEDWENYTIKVHALKSSSRIIGAEGAGEKAQALENAGKAGDIGYIKENHEDFVNDCMKVKEKLSGLFVDSDDSDKPEADAALMKDVYEEIRLSAENMDCDSLENLFKDMEDYRIPDSEKDLYSKLKEALERFDYDTMLELLR